MVGIKVREWRPMWLLAILVLSLVMVGHRYLYLPFVHEQNSLRTELRLVEGKLAEAKTLLNREEEIRRHHRQRQGELREAWLLLPSDKALSQLLLQLDVALENANVTLSYWRPGDVVPEGEVVGYSFSLGLSGTYDRVVSFLGVLEDFPRFLRLVAIDLNPAADSDRWQAHVQVEAFYLSDGEAGDGGTFEPQ